MFSLTVCLRTQICSEPVAYEQRERTLSAHRGALRGQSLPALLMDGHLPPVFILLEKKAEGQVAGTGRLRSAELPAVSPAQAVAPGPLLTMGEMLPRAARQRFSCRGQQKFFPLGLAGNHEAADTQPPGETPLRGCAACAARGSRELGRCGAGCGGPGLRSAFGPHLRAQPVLGPGSAENAPLIFSLAV